MIRLASLAVCVLFGSAPAYARTWTDYQGRSVEGEFVRVQRLKVFISADGKTIQVPFGHLSVEDQDFVREQLQAHGLGNQVPAKKKTAPSDSPKADASQADPPEKETKPAADEKKQVEKPKLGPERAWTDILGRTVKARLIGIEDAKVVLQLKGKPASFPFDKFSVADQEYVRGEMTARGEADKLPAAVPAVNVQPAPAVPQVAQAGPPAGVPTFPRFGPRGIQRPEVAAIPRMPEFRFPTVTPPTPVQPAPVQPPPIQPSIPSPTFQPVVHNTPFPNPTPVMPGDPMGNMQIKVKVCKGCNKIVPNDLTAGDRCPHCGVYFSYDETTGKSAHWGYFATPGGIGAVIAMIVYAFKRRKNA